MEEEIIQKIYKLTNELASQQQSNQDLATTLNGQLTDLKTKAAAAKSSTDDQAVLIPHPLLPEQRDQVLEDLKNRLEKALLDQQTTLQANQQLEKEVSELQGLVKDYETGLESITSKFRTHANATTEGQIRLRREYEALLNAEKGTTAALFIENTMLQTQLRQLSKSLRDVYRHESVDVHDQQISQLKKENQGLLELLKMSHLPDLEEASTQEKSSPVLQVARPGVVEEFFD
ncbi:hypothetical protein V8B55DRAFT_1382004 [Mucor lusitanicus]|uniref:Uncharacterized protein n=2 Tax=Mucor circinelloides f. lusitanicus TaxID=29924 RepID=A0A162MTG7_MUCCL|nr:hypothetical protein FB192DRAFT_1359766 [Mucor lusitanicus]OAD05235.1 hypothetical protein MUCCIDRAFT_189256 [Mucor lusitanicus CBS 277.49]